MAVVTQIQVRRGTASQWTSANPTLASGEFGYETDTGKAKIGNGSTAWNSLAYAITGTDGDITGVTAGTGISGGGTSGTVTVSIDTAVTADLTTAQTLTNKTLTTPIISSISNTGTLTLPTSTDTLVGRATTDTLTNKTLTTPVISSISNSGTVTIPTGTVTLATLTGTETLTNKTLTDPKINLAFTADSGASYTAVLTDNGKVVTMDNGSGNTFRLPTNASVAFPIGTQINVLQIGAGQTTINAVTSGTTTIQSTGGTAAAPKLRTRYSSATCIKAATDLWYVIGDIS
jgi:hypothetical protein